MKHSERANFGSKLGIILATAGSAVGLGNVWRFPYMTGENGGAVFILVYIVCVLLLGIPCMISEFIIGRHGASNSARAYSKLANGSVWKVIGYIGVMTGFIITGYYAVVSGWCLQYIYGTLVGQMTGDAAYYQTYFADFSTNAWKPILCAVVFLFATHFIITRGVEKGIERASKMMMPTLFVLLLVIVVASCMLPGASKGINYLLKPDFGELDKDVFLGGLGQAFYSLSIGMGCICTYASYFSRDTNLTKSAVEISVIDSLIAILAGLMIFPAAFSVGVQPDSGPSLIFITLPNVFQQAFGSVPLLPLIVSLLFYILLSLAALTSLISLHEVSTAFFHEELKVSRNKGAWIVTLGCSVVAAFCALSFGGREGLTVMGKTLFDAADFVTGQILLPFGGLLTSLFIGWYVPTKISRDEFTNDGTLKGSLYGVWLFCVRYVCPISIMAIFLHQFGVI